MRHKSESRKTENEAGEKPVHEVSRPVTTTTAKMRCVPGDVHGWRWNDCWLLEEPMLVEEKHSLKCLFHELTGVKKSSDTVLLFGGLGQMYMLTHVSIYGSSEALQRGSSAAFVPRFVQKVSKNTAWRSNKYVSLYIVFLYIATPNMNASFSRL